ncbi:hypothetical protein HKX48_000471 [Thoreauomyces humboldtii]|nr:hypothetical protein HKX48_000471 [Thoreauomyces humboldtii]
MSVFAFLSTHSLFFPGSTGHLEVGEEWAECGAREVLEEAGIAITPPQFVTATNDVFDSDKHYVTIFTHATCIDEDPTARRMEPDKCAGWEWVTWEEVFGEGSVHRPLFLPMLNLAKSGTKRPW